MEFFKHGVRSPVDAIKNKAYSKVGDGLANLVYSLAKARASHELRGDIVVAGTPKVSAVILKGAWVLARDNVKQDLHVRGDAHAIADAVEAIVAYGWINGLVTLEDAVLLVSKKLIESRPAKTRDEINAFSAGFADVIVKILA